MDQFRRKLACVALLAAAHGAGTAHALTIDANAVTPDEGVTLAPAPRWNSSMVPSAPYFSSKSVSPVAPIDTTNKSAVVAAYNTYYNLAMPALGFTGNSTSPTCAPGAISLAFQEWTLTRINFLRAMAGVPGNTTLDSSLNTDEQAAALIMATNKLLDHSPPSNLLCWTQAGLDGASSSNLALGDSLTDSIPLYMQDFGGGNEIAGHRRWILHSAKNSFGLGQATGAKNASALYVFQFGNAISVPNGILWPPRGYVPLDLFPSTPVPGEGPRWSFGLPNADFFNATVTMTLNGASLATTILSSTDDGYGDNTIVWSLPSGHTVVKGSTYVVTISGVGGVVPTSYSYQVLPFDTNDPITNALTVGKAGTGSGLVTSAPAGINCGAGCTGNYAPATSVTLTAAPANGSIFVGWSGSGCSGTGGCTLSMSQPRSVTASFNLDPADNDGDGIPNGVEIQLGTNPNAKDNDIFSPGAGSARLFAMQLYRDFLGREGDPAGIQGWTDAVANATSTRPQVIDAFLSSTEFAGFVAPVVRLYFATFLRVPDYAGLTFNAGLVRNATITVTQLADFFTQSPEFMATYGSLNNTQFVTLLYNNVLGRAPDAGGLNGWVQLLTTGGYSRGQVLVGFSESTEFQASSANEVFVTMMYTGMLRRTPDPGGFSGWVSGLDAATYTRTQVINGFFLSTEYRKRFLP
jgi:Domain of unknown function (DUF4214)/Divergent InlB B-repeat domain/Bacterial TSP3 repeat